mmetsp:Transcript_24366/g.56624  ORF Transcript_24366/g.56624 Transcript_24366/m.56624 type:complete len:218 (-) Transcript_24366:193-846(-)
MILARRISLRGSRLAALLKVGLSVIVLLSVGYLCWAIGAHSRRQHESSDDSEDGDETTELASAKRPSRRRNSAPERHQSFDNHLIWTVLRPVVSQVIASALQDRSTQTAFRNLCTAVLSNDAMKEQFREVVADVWHNESVQRSLADCIVSLCSSPRVGHSLAVLLRNACVDDEASAGLASVLAKSLKECTPNGSSATLGALDCSNSSPDMAAVSSLK